MHSTAIAGPVDEPSIRDAANDWANRHLLAIWRFARLLCGSGHGADDLAQEALLAGLAKHVHQLPDAAARAWLREAVRNLWRMQCRTQGRRGAAIDIELADLAWAENPDDDGTTWQDALTACLHDMPQRPRDALLRRYGNGEERDAVASALGIGIDGLKSLLQRSKQLLRECIERRLHRSDAAAPPRLRGDRT